MQTYLKSIVSCFEANYKQIFCLTLAILFCFSSQEVIAAGGGDPFEAANDVMEQTQTWIITQVVAFVAVIGLIVKAVKIMQGKEDIHCLQPYGLGCVVAFGAAAFVDFLMRALGN